MTLKIFSRGIDCLGKLIIKQRTGKYLQSHVEHYCLEKSSQMRGPSKLLNTYPLNTFNVLQDLVKRKRWIKTSSCFYPSFYFRVFDKVKQFLKNITSFVNVLI